jgi:hypothetical protein
MVRSKESNMQNSSKLGHSKCQENWSRKRALENVKQICQIAKSHLKLDG